MKSKYAAFVFIMLCSQIAVAETFLSQIYPKGVYTGMTLDELRATRKQLLDGGHPTKNGINLVERLNSLTFGWYYLRQGKLVGYMRITRAALLDTKQKVTEEALVDPEKSGEFTKIGVSQAARSTRDLQMETIQVVNWKSKATPDLELYTVDSPSEITVIAFEPSSLSWKDFFIGPEIKDELEASRRHIEKVLSDANALKRLSSTPSAAQASSRSVVATATPIVAVKKPGAAAEKPSPNFPIVPLVILAAVIAGAVVFSLRRKF